MKIEIEKSDYVTIQGNKIEIEGAKYIFIDGENLELIDRDEDSEDADDDDADETDDPDNNPIEDVDEIPIESLDLSPSTLVASIEANKKPVIFPANERDIITIKKNIGTFDNVVIDYTFKFEDDFIFGRGGKFGCGIGIGKGTTGCKDIEPDGASIRFMWRGIKNEDGEYVLNDFKKQSHAVLYVYHQNRVERCGDNYFFGKLEAGKTHRITLQVISNYTADLLDRVNVWLDGQHALSLDLELIKSEDLLDSFMYWQSFRGGAANDPTWYPPVENKAYISEVTAHVLN